MIFGQAVCELIEDYKVSSKLKSESGGSVGKLSKEQSEQFETH